ncbi:hypothetical protein BC828DRAFT_441529 [Blastocladiella britannica]|nr:hypothetical protein BC828DRAFT_441529 [Blastocladiella britannica]
MLFDDLFHLDALLAAELAPAALAPAAATSNTSAPAHQQQQHQSLLHPHQHALAAPQYHLASAHLADDLFLDPIFAPTSAAAAASATHAKPPASSATSSGLFDVELSALLGFPVESVPGSPQMVPASFFGGASDDVPSLVPPSPKLAPVVAPAAAVSAVAVPALENMASALPPSLLMPPPQQMFSVMSVTGPGNVPAQLFVPMAGAQAVSASFPASLAASAAASLAAYHQRRMQSDAAAPVATPAAPAASANATTDAPAAAAPCPLSTMRSLPATKVKIPTEKLQYPAHLIPFDAPVQKKRKAVEAGLPEAGGGDEDEEAKRLKNTLSARKSRARRAARLGFLEDRVVELEQENGRVKAELEQAKAQMAHMSALLAAAGSR